MPLNDIFNGEGVGVIDPHGDLAEKILDYIPNMPNILNSQISEGFASVKDDVWCGWREAQKKGRVPFSFEPAFLAWEAKVLDQSVQ